jgi:hypothetical protein
MKGLLSIKLALGLYLLNIGCNEHSWFILIAVFILFLDIIIIPLQMVMDDIFMPGGYNDR